MTEIEAEKSAIKITITYDDGTKKEIDKGCVWYVTNISGENAEITAEMVSMDGRDLFTIVSTAIELGDRLGMFKCRWRI